MSWMDFMGQISSQPTVLRDAVWATHWAWRWVTIIELLGVIGGWLFFTGKVLFFACQSGTGWKIKCLEQVRYFAPLVLASLAVGGLFSLRSALQTPQGFLQEFGVSSAWHLTPQGVTAILQWLKILFYTQIVMAFTGIFSLFLCFLIPSPEQTNNQSQTSGQPNAPKPSQANAKRMAVSILLALIVLCSSIGTLARASSEPPALETINGRADSDCLELESASWVPAQDSHPRKIALNMKVRNPDRVTGSVFKVEWQAPFGAARELPSIVVSKSKPVEITYLLDLDQTLIRPAGALETEQARIDEREFWKDIANLLVTQLDLHGVDPTDKAMIFTAQSAASHKVGTPLCTQPAKTSTQDGVVDCMLDAVQYSYGGLLLPIDSEKDKVTARIIRDEWPEEIGRKVIVILRWRDMLPDGSSGMYGIPGHLEPTTFIFILGRSVDPPSEWDEQLAQWKRHNYHVTYVAAPPAYQQQQPMVLRQIDSALQEMANAVEVSRQGMASVLSFPVLPDETAATNGILVLRQDSCRFSFGLPDSVLENVRGLPPSKMIWFWVTLASTLLALEILLMIGAVLYRTDPKIKDEVDGWKWGMRPGNQGNMA